MWDLAGGTEGGDDRECCAGTGRGVHAALRHGAPRIPGSDGVDGPADRGGTRGADRLRPPPRRRGRPPPRQHLGARPAGTPGSVRSTPTRPVRGYRSRSARSRHASPDSASPPNRVTALGEDFLLLVHLAWSTHLPARFLRSGTGFAAAGRWKISYLPVYSGWAAPRGRWLPADPRIRPTTDRMGGLTGRANSTRAGRRQPSPGTNPPSTDPSWAAPTPGRGAEGDATSGCARRRRDHPASRSSFPPRTSGRDS